MEKWKVCQKLIELVLMAILFSLPAADSDGNLLFLSLSHIPLSSTGLNILLLYIYLN